MERFTKQRHRSTGHGGLSVTRTRNIPLHRALWLCLVAGTLGSTTAAGQEAEQSQKDTVQSETSCKCHPKLVGKCFTVHGRLSLYKSAPTGRIWIIGTKRTLGLTEGVPEWLEDDLESRNTTITGDYLVCPLTRAKPGVMQSVCIESSSNLVVKNIR